ncbi:hypothetical protein LX64_02546 [Chitinophaga skermanii]|uniref:Uncharacterized protein n=1 Tax=Chitinophaga skermanii TaxID=331697 RepID=A0A327QMX1_9BACT|nr:hypothetical protein [Chitinophaga skermanii]RAJ05388.1 hypothetical protein LX64_02546 [Chitinophaga skermanii]
MKNPQFTIHNELKQELPIVLAPTSLLYELPPQHALLIEMQGELSPTFELTIERDIFGMQLTLTPDNGDYEIIDEIAKNEK